MTEPVRFDCDVIIYKSDNLASCQFEPFLDWWKMPGFRHPASSQRRLALAQLFRLGDCFPCRRIVFTPYDDQFVRWLSAAHNRANGVDQSPRRPVGRYNDGLNEQRRSEQQ